MRRSRIVLAAALAGAAALATAALTARTAQFAPSTSPTTPINLTGPPEPVLYRFLFSAVNHEQQYASQREAAGEDASAARQFLVLEAKLTPGQNDTVVQVASDFQTADAQLAAQQQKLINAFRAGLRAQREFGAAPPEDPGPRASAAAR